MGKKKPKKNNNDDFPFNDDGWIEDTGKKHKLDRRKKEKKPSIFSKLKGFSEGRKSNLPVTFNVGLNIILFLVYFSIMIVSVPTYPALLIIILPTLYVIVRGIKLEREQLGEKFGD